MTALTFRAGCKERDVSENGDAGPVRNQPWGSAARGTWSGVRHVARSRWDYIHSSRVSLSVSARPRVLPQLLCAKQIAVERRRIQHWRRGLANHAPCTNCAAEARKAEVRQQPHLSVFRAGRGESELKAAPSTSSVDPIALAVLGKSVDKEAPRVKGVELTTNDAFPTVYRGDSNEGFVGSQWIGGL